MEIQATVQGGGQAERRGGKVEARGLWRGGRVGSRMAGEKPRRLRTCGARVFAWTLLRCSPGQKIYVSTEISWALA